MTAFFNISVWITLAMVIPGLVSMATLFGAMVVGNTCCPPPRRLRNSAIGLSPGLR